MMGIYPITGFQWATIHSRISLSHISGKCQRPIKERFCKLSILSKRWTLSKTMAGGGADVLTGFQDLLYREWMWCPLSPRWLWFREGPAPGAPRESWNDGWIAMWSKVYRHPPEFLSEAHDFSAIIVAWIIASVADDSDPPSIRDDDSKNGETDETLTKKGLQIQKIQYSTRNKNEVRKPFEDKAWIINSQMGNNERPVSTGRKEIQTRRLEKKSSRHCQGAPDYESIRKTESQISLKKEDVIPPAGRPNKEEPRWSMHLQPPKGHRRMLDRIPKKRLRKMVKWAFNIFRSQKKIMPEKEESEKSEHGSNQVREQSRDEMSSPVMRREDLDNQYSSSIP